MAGGGFILGGLLQGVGRGMEQNFLARREEALQRLRQQQTLEAEDRADKRTMASEARAEDRDIRKETRTEEAYGRKQGIDFQNDVQKLKVAGDIKSQDRKEQFGYDVQLTSIKAGEDRKTASFRAKLDQDLATMKAELDRNNDADSQRLRAELDGGNIKDRVTDANGRVILIRQDGQMVTTPFTEKEKVDTSSYGRPERKRGPTPEGFDPKSRSAPSNSGDDGPWYSPGARSAETEKVATAAQVREAAKAQGMTEAQVRSWMQSNGWSFK